MVRSVNPKREKKELGYFCIFLHLVFGRVFLPQLQLCTNLSKNRKIKQHCQVTLMRAFTHFIPTIKPTNERNSFRYVFSRVSNVSETNFRHAPDMFYENYRRKNLPIHGIVRQHCQMTFLF